MIRRRETSSHIDSNTCKRRS